MTELDSALKSRLHSRMIPFQTYSFADGSHSVIVTLVSDRFSVNVPYHINISEGGYLLVAPSVMYEADSINNIVSRLVLDVRKTEVRFNKWKK